MPRYCKESLRLQSSTEFSQTQDFLNYFQTIKKEGNGATPFPWMVVFTFWRGSLIRSPAKSSVSIVYSRAGLCIHSRHACTGSYSFQFLWRRLNVLRLEHTKVGAKTRGPDPDMPQTANNRNPIWNSRTPSRMRPEPARMVLNESGRFGTSHSNRQASSSGTIDCIEPRLRSRKRSASCVFLFLFRSGKGSYTSKKITCHAKREVLSGSEGHRQGSGQRICCFPSPGHYKVLLFPGETDTWIAGCYSI